VKTSEKCVEGDGVGGNVGLGARDMRRVGRSLLGEGVVEGCGYFDAPCAAPHHHQLRSLSHAVCD
jgi:hypothetical protein